MSTSYSEKGNLFPLKVVGSVFLCAIVAIVLYFLSASVIFFVCKAISSLRSPFDFSMHDVFEDSLWNQIIPGAGSLMSIFQDPNMSSRTFLFIGCIVVMIALAIGGGLLYLVKKITPESNTVGIIAIILLILEFILAFYMTFFTSAFEASGISKGFWFYIVSIITLAIHAVIIYFIGSILMEEDAF